MDESEPIPEAGATPPIQPCTTVVRPSRATTGTGHGVKPCSAAERQRRLDYACELLISCKFKSDQIAQLCNTFGMSWRNGHRYLAAARQRILASVMDATGKPKDEWLAESILMYDSISKDPLVKVADRLAARKQLDRALGNGGVVVVHAQQVNVGKGSGQEERDLSAIVDQVRDWQPPAKRGEPPPGAVVVHAEVGDDHAGD